MRTGSLFSGVGGLELGLERAGLGPVVWQAESDPFCRRVLAKHWPGVKCYERVEDVNEFAEPVDIVCGGFPCQDLSVAGRRTGLSGERSGLWREFARVVRELDPDWVVVENVHHTWRRWVPFVRGDLGELGYSSVPLRLSAADVGAGHRRRRVFVLAHADGELLRELSRRWGGSHGEMAQISEWPSRWPGASRVPRTDDGVSHGVDRRRALGNAVVPQVAEVIGRAIAAAERGG